MVKTTRLRAQEEKVSDQHDLQVFGVGILKGAVGGGGDDLARGCGDPLLEDNKGGDGNEREGPKPNNPHGCRDPERVENVGVTQRSRFRFRFRVWVWEVNGLCSIVVVEPPSLRFGS